MANVVGVRFKKAGKIYYFSPNDIDVKRGDFAIVETARGIEFGSVVSDIKTVPDSELILPLKEVIRVATDQDILIHRENLAKAKEAQAICAKKIEEHNLDMKLINAEYTFDNNKVLFYFTADNRIDFRELVKELALIFKIRIELRHIGVRDEAKLIGSLGYCGRETCCSNHLSEFNPVSIKMAKDQSISLNPTKISGICGRLMCCLSYEQEGYEYLLKKMPKVGSVITTERGKGTVIQISPLQEMVKAKFDLKDEIVVENLSIDDIIITGEVDKNFTPLEDDLYDKH